MNPDTAKHNHSNQSVSTGYTKATQTGISLCEYVWTFSIFSWIKTPQDIKIKMLLKFVNPWFHAVLKM